MVQAEMRINLGRLFSLASSLVPRPFPHASIVFPRSMGYILRLRSDTFVCRCPEAPTGACAERLTEPDLEGYGG
jgi:hypothetical protein